VAVPAWRCSTARPLQCRLGGTPGCSTHIITLGESSKPFPTPPLFVDTLILSRNFSPTFVKGLSHEGFLTLAFQSETILCPEALLNLIVSSQRFQIRSRSCGPNSRIGLGTYQRIGSFLTSHKICSTSGYLTTKGRSIFQMWRRIFREIRVFNRIFLQMQSHLRKYFRPWDSASPSCGEVCTKKKLEIENTSNYPFKVKTKSFYLYS
jgi:hypothetical protein